MSRSSDESCCCRIELVFAAFLLRLWVGMRLFIAGLEKFRSGDSYGLEWVGPNVKKFSDPILEYTPIPKFAVDAFGAVLPWALLVVGGMVLVGFARKFALLAGGLILLGLGMGLMLLPDDFEAVQIGISVAITAFALMVTAHDKISVDGVIGLAAGKKSGDSDEK